MTRQSYVSTARGLYLSPTLVRVGLGFLAVAALAALAVNWPDLRRYTKFETM